MIKALIFGCNGQIGSYLCEHYLQEGIEVVGIKRRSSSNNLSRISHLLNKMEVEEGDVCDPSSIFFLLSKYRPSIIINTAAQSHVHTSFNQPNYTFQVTANGVLNILEAILQLYRDECQQVRFLQYSSSEMFGRNYNLDKNMGKYQDENTAMVPQSPYAIAKLAGYHFTRLYREAYQLFASNIIQFNTESPRRGENFVTRKITHYIGQLQKKLAGGQIKIIEDNYVIGPKDTIIPKLQLGNIHACRDWLHAKDAVKAAALILEHDEPDDFVIATGQTHTIQDFLELAFGYVNLNWADFVNINESLFRPAEVDYLKGNFDKARRILKWEPQISFEELVRDMVESDLK